MAEIVEISGLERGVRRSAPQSRSVSGIQEEIKQRAALVKKRPPIDTANLSEGEMLVELVRQRMAILADYYPDYPQYRSAATMGENALFQGLHTGTGVGAWTKVLDPIQQEMAWAIIEGKGQTDPASGWLPWELKPRTPLDGGFAVSGGGIYGIPELDCNALYPSTPPAGMPASVVASWAAEQDARRAACRKQNEWRTLLNDKYEQTGHHPLYKFYPDPNSAPGVVGTKYVLHRNSIGALAQISKISETNLTQWQINGILAQNIAKGAGALSPIETIEGLKQAAAEDVGSLTVAALVAIITAISGAIAAAGGLILAIKGKDEAAATTFQSVAQGWGTPTYGPEKSDWQTTTGGGNTGGGSNNNGGGDNTGGGGGGFNLDLGNLSNKQIATGLGVAALGWWALSK